MKQYQLYETWWKPQEGGDQEMENDHLEHWEKIIPMISETDLSQLTVLDFGCNQGRFLRVLYEHRPFKRAVGVDLARKSIAVANERKGDLPIQYETADSLQAYQNQFDLAISSAVMYLIPDLAEHARQIRYALKPGGVYYATFSDELKNPSFPKFKKEINRQASIEMQYHTLDDVVSAFEKEGFKVFIQRFAPSFYLNISAENEFHYCVADRLRAFYEESYIFRFAAPEE